MCCEMYCTEVNSSVTVIVAVLFFWYSNQQRGNALNLLSPDCDCFLCVRLNFFYF